MMILLILWLILSLSAAAPLNSNVFKEELEEDLVTDDIASVDIVNGDGDELHNHREARHVFYGGNIKFSGTTHSFGTHARVNIGLISTNALSQELHNEPEPQEGVEILRCDQEYQLNGMQRKKLEFILKPLADEDQACKFTINIADGFHGLVNCMSSVTGSVKINRRETKTYNGTGPIRIEWLADGKDRMDGKMYCDVGMVKLVEEIKLKGRNGIEASVEDIEEAYSLNLETIDITKEELAANLEDNKERMLEVNTNPDRSWTASIGKLSIFTKDYVVETMTGLIEESEDQQRADADRMEQELLAPQRKKRELPSDIPESVDLVEMGAVSSVKDQGQCGSCAAFAATSAIETCVYNANGNVMHGDLSEQNLMDCGFGYDVNNGCNGGSAAMYFRFLKEKYVGMLADEKDYAYWMEDRKCLPINAKNTGAMVTDCYSSNELKEEDVMALVAAGNQVASSIYVVGDFNLYNGKGIFDSDQCCDSAGADGNMYCATNHVVGIVGYGTENGVPYWKIKNSWGNDWGDKGFMKIVRGRKHCSITSKVSIPKCSAGTPKPVQGGSLWIQSNDMDCWSAGCKAKGLCPSVCGADGYCCREGYDGCPPEAAKASPKYHSCVTKKASCSGTASDWACCSSTSPCQKNEGDCDSDSECAGTLVCGTDNCRSINPLAHHSADCCIQPVCSNNAINWADCFCEGSIRGESCTAGQRCTAGTCQSGQRCAGRNFGGRNCCTPENPCDEGEGDCDGPGEGEHDGHAGCKGDLVCGSNNCKQFGTYYHEKDDCCEKQIPSSPPEGQRCSGRYFGEKRCCTPENPCDEGEGDCDGPGDGGDHDGHAGCKGDLVCGSNNCKQFGTYYHEMDDCCQKDIELS